MKGESFKGKIDKSRFQNKLLVEKIARAILRGGIFGSGKILTEESRKFRLFERSILQISLTNGVNSINLERNQEFSNPLSLGARHNLRKESPMWL